MGTILGPEYIPYSYMEPLGTSVSYKSARRVHSKPKAYTSA